MQRAWRGSAVALFAAFGVGAAVYYFLGDACRSSERIDGLYAAPLLLGVASFVYVTRGIRRWWWGIAAGIATTVASAVLLVFLALLHYSLGGCYT